MSKTDKKLLTVNVHCGHTPGMKLCDYLNDHEQTLAEFAARIGVANPKVVQRYSSGQRIPRPSIMTKIVEATGGAVQPNDFFTEPEREPESQPEKAA